MKTNSREMIMNTLRAYPDQSFTAAELSIAAVVSVFVARRVMNEFVSGSLAYVAEYSRAGANIVPHYKAGNHPSVQRPATISTAERIERERNRRAAARAEMIEEFVPGNWPQLGVRITWAGEVRLCQL